MKSVCVLAIASALMGLLGVSKTLTAKPVVVHVQTCHEPQVQAPAPRFKDPLTSFEGVVTAVDAKSITIRGFLVRGSNPVWSGGNETGSEGWSAGPKMNAIFPDREIPCIRFAYTRETRTVTYPNGDVEVFQRAKEPPRKFLVDDILASGGWPEDQNRGCSYRLSDVRVGDEVYIRLGRKRDDGVCYAISIRRRPGGRVPLAPGDDPDGPHTFHGLMNAQQDFEEKGTPIPWKYLSFSERQKRIAPMPRELTR